MTVFNVGTDIVSVSRIKETYESAGEKFLHRILTANELRQLPQRDMAKVAFISKRWAAKEAVAKAFTTGIGEFLSFTDIEIQHTNSGAPQIKLSQRGKDLAKKMGISEFKISISDEKTYAVAFVIAVT